MNYIIGALQTLAHLRVLDFSHNACGAPGMKELSALIKSTKTLVVLKITNVGISPVRAGSKNRMEGLFWEKHWKKQPIKRKIH